MSSVSRVELLYSPIISETFFAPVEKVLQRYYFKLENDFFSQRYFAFHQFWLISGDRLIFRYKDVLDRGMFSENASSNHLLGFMAELHW